MREASINAKIAGERGITAKSVRKVTEVSYYVMGACRRETVITLLR